MFDEIQRQEIMDGSAGDWRRRSGRWICVNDSPEVVAAEAFWPVVTDDDGYIDVDLSPLVPDHPGGMFDCWSALHRPGAWEWSTAWAEDVRDVLMAAGWWPTVAPGAPWRRVWVRKEAAAAKGTAR